MTTATSSGSAREIAPPANLRELIEKLGDIPLSRILLEPAPGLATEADILDAERRYQRLYELVDGVLVEKGTGYTESIIAGVFIQILRNFVVPRNLGLVSSPDGIVRLFPGLVRIPDVAFASWERFPDRKMPKEPVPSLVPDLVIEVLSESNTRLEMERKRAEYFTHGVQLIWEVDAGTRTVVVYTPEGSVKRLDSSGVLDGGTVLVGFLLPIAELFAELDRHG